MVEEQLPVIKVEEFLRLHPLRAPGIAWFLGAGASAAAGIPTAYDMIWEFKRSLFCAAQRVSLESCADLGSSEVRLRLQRHFDDRGGFPPQDSALEYAEYFEAAYPDEGDRQRYLDRQVMRGTPSFGHYALAALMRADRVRMVWTPNFDPMIEDVVAQMFGTTGRLTTATLDGPELALQAMNEARWPILGKVHGDFRSRRLKNVSEELRTQDATLRRALIESCRRLGLAVVGCKQVPVSVGDGSERSLLAALTTASMLRMRLTFGLRRPPRQQSADLDASTECALASDRVRESEARSLVVRSHHSVIEGIDLLLVDEHRGVKKPQQFNRQFVVGHSHPPPDLAGNGQHPSS